MTIQAALLAHIHMVPVRDDVVVLDTRADRYACLVGAACLLAFDGPGHISADPEVMDDLMAAELVALGIPAPVRRSPTPPHADLEGAGPGGPLRALDIAARSLIATAQFRNRPLDQLIARQRPGSRTAKSSDPRRISMRASTYRQVLPFLPGEGACLQRAWQLRQVLAFDGLDVDWVFGVRTWPFFAHCWLQYEDRVIGDRIEHVRAFTPIAVF
jgi:hypothetical protein